MWPNNGMQNFNCALRQFRKFFAFTFSRVIGLNDVLLIVKYIENFCRHVLLLELMIMCNSVFLMYVYMFQFYNVMLSWSVYYGRPM